MTQPGPRVNLRTRQPYALVPSVVTYAAMLVFVVCLFEYTNTFNSWLAWVVVPAVMALVAYDVHLRSRGVGGD